MSSRLRFLAALALTMSAGQVFAQAPASLRVTTAPTLVDCKGQQCFRLVVNAFDAAGNAMALPANASFEVSEGARTYTVFHTVAVTTPQGSGTTAANTSQARFVFLVVDTSGSMREAVEGGTTTKFETARAAILQTLLASFREGTDLVAVAGFDSVNVRSRIENAPFRATRAEAEADLQRLAPSRTGNTALYLAVDFALDRIDAIPSLAIARGKQPDVLLVVFTDGENDVRPNRGDDPGLLVGSDGMESVLAKARRRASQMPLTIITVGLEGRKTFNQEALRRLAFPAEAKMYYRAQNRSDLERAFGSITIEKANRVFLSFGPVRRSREELAATPVAFRVALGDLSATSPSFEPPAMGPPPPGAPLTDSERTAFERAFPPAADSWLSPRLSTMLMRLAILSVYSLLLATLWFGVPRLIWPERYIPGEARLATQAPRRPASAAGRPARPGIGDVTIVNRGEGRQPPAPAGPAAPAPDTARAARGAPQALPQPGGGRPRPAPAAPPRAAPRAPANSPPDATVFIPSKKPPTE